MQFGDNRKTVIITGASSGLGKATVDALANLGEYGKWHIVMAVRDTEKAREVSRACLLAPNWQIRVASGPADVPGYTRCDVGAASVARGALGSMPFGTRS